MLYVTTRNDRDVYTAQRALRENRATDGGLYVPFRDPNLSAEDIKALGDKSFNRCVAETLNMLFQTQLTPWDVDFVIGRYAVRLERLGQRIVIAESWHNLESDFSRLVKNLGELLTANADAEPQSGAWAEIGIRIAVLFGIFGELMREGIADIHNRVDISVVSSDFSAPMSAWYARKWGLPIGNIVCCCNENNAVWNLFTHGALRADGISVTTLTPEADVCIPDSLERLIYECGGSREAERFVECIRKGETYYPDDAVLAKLRQGMYVSVVNTPRMMDIIPNAYTTHDYILSPYSALAYGGLLDYRAVSGESRRSLILAERSPGVDRDTVSKALGSDFAI